MSNLILLNSYIVLGGEFYVSIDTIAPQLTPISMGNWSKTGVVRVKVADSQTGISSYRATLDGQWTLMEYTSKNRTLTLRLADYPLKRSGSLHHLCITVTDGVGNTSTLERSIKY